MPVRQPVKQLPSSSLNHYVTIPTTCILAAHTIVICPTRTTVPLLPLSSTCSACYILETEHESTDVIVIFGFFDSAKKSKSQSVPCRLFPLFYQHPSVYSHCPWCPATRRSAPTRRPPPLRPRSSCVIPHHPIHPGWSRNMAGPLWASRSTASAGSSSGFCVWLLGLFQNDQPCIEDMSTDPQVVHTQLASRTSMLRPLVTYKSTGHDQPPPPGVPRSPPAQYVWYHHAFLPQACRLRVL